MCYLAAHHEEVLHFGGQQLFRRAVSVVIRQVNTM